MCDFAAVREVDHGGELNYSERSKPKEMQYHQERSNFKPAGHDVFHIGEIKMNSTYVVY